MENKSPSQSLPESTVRWLQERPALAATVFLAIGIAFRDAIPPHPLIWLLLAAALLPLRRSGAIAAALVLIGLTAAQIEQFQFPVNHISAYTTDSERFAQIEVKLDQEPRLAAPPPGELRDLPPKQTTEAAVRAIRTPTGWQPATGRILLSIEQSNPRLAAGQILRCTGMLQRPMPPMNPGEFDFADFCRQHRILAEMRVAHADGIQILADPGASPLLWFREKTRRLLAMGFPLSRGDDHAMLRAFVLGDPDPQLQDVIDDFVRTGTVHLFATSGLHVAIVGAIVLLICRLLRFPPRRTVLIALSVVVIYATAATPSWPGWRSIIMGSAGAIGVLSRRRAHAVQLFFVAIAAILLCHPADLRDGGFQVSFAAVLGMILLAEPASQGFWTWWRGPDAIALGPPRHGPFRAALRWTIHFLVSTFIAGVIAWLLAMPLIAWHFNQINFWSIPAGVAILPLAVIALVAGLGKILLSAAWPSASGLWTSLCTAPLHWLRDAVHLIDKFPGATVAAAPPLWLLVLYYALMAAFFFRPSKPTFRKLTWAAPFLACATFTIWPAASAPASTTGDLQITLLSLGAGQCGIIRLPSGHAVFIDAGSSTVSDLTRRLIDPYLRQMNCRQVDQVILSHGDFDHISSAADLFFEYHAPISTSPHFARNAVGNLPAEALLETLTETGQPPHLLARGDHVALSSDATLDVLWPPKDCDMNSNNCGLVLKLHYAGRTVLFPADIQSPPEAALLKSPADLKSDVLVAPHHGSAESTTPAFIQAVNPAEILASNARKLTHKQRLFDSEASAWPLVRTHRFGAVTVTIARDGRLSFSTFLNLPTPAATLPTTQKSPASQVSN